MNRVTGATILVLAALATGSQAPAQIVNGDFSSGNTGFLTDYTFLSAPNPAPGDPCYPNIKEGCYAIANSTVGNRVSDYYNVFQAIPDHTGGAPGNMLFANGAPSLAFVWKQTVTVSAGTNYLFSAWVSSVLPAGDAAPANLRMQVDISAGCSGTSTFTGLGTLNAPALPGWTQGLATVTTGTSTSICLGLLNQNLAASGNDFAIDDLSLTTDPRIPVEVRNATVNTAQGVAGTRNVVTNDVTAGSQPVDAASVDLDPSTYGRQTLYTYTNASGSVTFTVDNAGLVTYTPSAGFLGTAPCGWRVFTTGAPPVPSGVATLSVVVAAPPPAPTASNGGPYCDGGTIALFASTVAGATYAWTGPGGYSSNQQNPTRTGATTAMAGLYSVTATVGGLTSTPGTTTVVVNAIPAAPAATNGGPYSPGATIQLNASTVAGATYAWTGPGGYSSNQQNPTRPAATAAMAGLYSVTATVAGCTSTAGTTTVTIIGPPTAWSINPTAGPLAGGTTVTIAGTNFTAGATVSFGATAGTVTSLSPTSITVTSPAGAAAATVSVKVTNPDTQSVTLGQGFTYNPTGCWPETTAAESRMVSPCFPTVAGDPRNPASTPIALGSPDPNTVTLPPLWQGGTPDDNTIIFFQGAPPSPRTAGRKATAAATTPPAQADGAYRRNAAIGSFELCLFQGTAPRSAGSGAAALAASAPSFVTTSYKNGVETYATTLEFGSSKGDGVFDRIRKVGGVEFDLPIVTMDVNGDGFPDYGSLPWGAIGPLLGGFIGDGGAPRETPQIWMPLADTDGDGIGDAVVFDPAGTGQPSAVIPSSPPLLPPVDRRANGSIPALGEWGLFALALSLAGAGWLALRRTIG